MSDRCFNHDLLLLSHACEAALLTFSLPRFSPFSSSPCSVVHLTTDQDHTYRFRHPDETTPSKRPLTAGGIHMMPYANMRERTQGVVFYP